MRRWLLAGTVGVFVMASVAPALAVDEVSADQLLADPASFDGVEVTLEGELIGDRHGGLMLALGLVSVARMRRTRSSELVRPEPSG